MQKISNWFPSNKMAVNTSKTKSIVFRTRGKRTNPADCLVFYNNNETGLPEDPNLIFPVTSVHSSGEETSFKLLGIIFTNTFRLNTM
jgi:hypothetical protein